MIGAARLWQWCWGQVGSGWEGFLVARQTWAEIEVEVEAEAVAVAVALAEGSRRSVFQGFIVLLCFLLSCTIKCEVLSSYKRRLASGLQRNRSGCSLQASERDRITWSNQPPPIDP